MSFKDAAKTEKLEKLVSDESLVISKKEFSKYGYSNDLKDFLRSDDFITPETEYKNLQFRSDDGTYFLVYDAETFNGIKVVLKFLALTDGAYQRAVKRNLNTEKIMDKSVSHKDSQTFTNLTRPRTELAKDKTPFIVEEQLKETLQEKFEKNYRILDEKTFFKSGNYIYQQNRNDFYDYITGIGSALYDMHKNVVHEVEREGWRGTYTDKTTGVPHGDVHAGNFAFSEAGIIKLFDRAGGTAERAIYEDDRSGVGHLLSRPKEQYVEGATPSKRADNYGAANIIFRSVSRNKKYFLEDVLESFNDKTIENEEERYEAQKAKFTEYMNSMSEKQLNKELRKELRKNVHRKFRKFLRKNLNTNEYKRAGSGELKEDIEKLINRLENKSWDQKFFKIAKIAGITSALTAGIISASIYTDRNNPVQDIHLPYNNPVITVMGELPKNTLRYTVEPVMLEDIGPAPNILPPQGSMHYRPLKRNFNTYMFGMSFLFASEGRPIIHRESIQEAWFDYCRSSSGSTQTPLVYDKLAKAIEQGLQASAKETNIADQEDVMTFVMLGRTRNKELRTTIDEEITQMANDSTVITQSNNPQNFEVYKHFVDIQGEPFFEEKDLEFIEKWRRKNYIVTEVIENRDPKDADIYEHNDKVVKNYFPEWTVPDELKQNGIKKPRPEWFPPMALEEKKVFEPMSFSSYITAMKDSALIESMRANAADSTYVFGQDFK